MDSHDVAINGHKENLKLNNCPCKRAMQNLKDWSIFVFKHNQNINKDKIITSYSLWRVMLDHKLGDMEKSNFEGLRFELEESQL